MTYSTVGISISLIVNSFIIRLNGCVIVKCLLDFLLMCVKYAWTTDRLDIICSYRRHYTTPQQESRSNKYKSIGTVENIFLLTYTIM